MDSTTCIDELFICLCLIYVVKSYSFHPGINYTMKLQQVLIVANPKPFGLPFR